MGKSKSDKSERSPLLPKGCKDLIDVIRQQQPQSSPESQVPEIHAWVFLPERVTLRYLALVSEKDVLFIWMQLNQLGIPFSIERGVDFDGARQLLLLYGIQAEPHET